MVELLGRHKVSTDFVRSTAIDCLALDLVAHNLFVDGIHADGSRRTQEIYEEKLSTNLLSLAVAVRTLLYQRAQDAAPCPDIAYCGFYDTRDEKDKADVSIKDICDKLIHADSIDRDVEGEDRKPTTCIKGRRQNHDWELNISVSLFCESILNWMDKIDEA